MHRRAALLAILATTLICNCQASRLLEHPQAMDLDDAEMATMELSQDSAAASSGRTILAKKNISRSPRPSPSPASGPAASPANNTSHGPVSDFCKRFKYTRYFSFDNFDDWKNAINKNAQPGDMFELLPRHYFLGDGKPPQDDDGNHDPTGGYGSEADKEPPHPATSATCFQRHGKPGKMITLCGARETIIDGTDSKKFVGYGIRVAESSYIRVSGFTLQNFMKPLDVQSTKYSEFKNIKSQFSLAEGLRFRYTSQFNVIENNTISNTGCRNDGFGEGIYIGTSKKNSIHFDLPPDQTSNNIIRFNTFGPGIKSENIDVKEFSNKGQIYSNSFYGKDSTGSKTGSAWVVVRGNGWVVRNNKGFGLDGEGAGYTVGFELKGNGLSNVISNNECYGLAKDQYCVFITPGALKNQVQCTNRLLNSTTDAMICNCNARCSKSGRSAENLLAPYSVPALTFTDSDDRPAWVDAI